MHRNSSCSRRFFLNGGWFQLVGIGLLCPLVRNRAKPSVCFVPRSLRHSPGLVWMIGIFHYLPISLASGTSS